MAEVDNGPCLVLWTRWENAAMPLRRRCGRRRYLAGRQQIHVHRRPRCLVAYATVRAKFRRAVCIDLSGSCPSADVKTFQLAIAIATVPSSTRWVCAAVV